MANWCYNRISFTGSEENLQKVIELFSQLREKEQKEQCGQKADFNTKDEWFFSIYVEETDYIAFESKWSPCIENITEIAKKFDLNYEYQFEECGNCVFGKAVYTSENEEPKIFNLEWSDFDLFEFDEDNDYYIYEGETYESDSEILETIFEKKFNTTY